MVFTSFLLCVLLNSCSFPLCSNGESSGAPVVTRTAPKFIVGVFTDLRGDLNGLDLRLFMLAFFLFVFSIVKFSAVAVVVVFIICIVRRRFASCPTFFCAECECECELGEWEPVSD